MADRDDRIIAMVDSIHADNLGGKHRNGFCEACADAYLVVQRALFPAPSEITARADVDLVERMRREFAGGTDDSLAPSKEEA